MKMYYFDNKGVGSNFTVLAKNHKEATRILKHYLDNNQEMWKDKPPVGIFKKGMDTFDIREYDQTEIIETE